MRHKGKALVHARGEPSTYSVVNITPRPLYHPGKRPRYPLNRTLVGHQTISTVWREKTISCPSPGIRTPDGLSRILVTTPTTLSQLPAAYNNNDKTDGESHRALCSDSSSNTSVCDSEHKTSSYLLMPYRPRLHLRLSTCRIFRPLHEGQTGIYIRGNQTKTSRHQLRFHFQTPLSIYTPQCYGNNNTGLLGFKHSVVISRPSRGSLFMMPIS